MGIGNMLPVSRACAGYLGLCFPMDRQVRSLLSFTTSLKSGKTSPALLTMKLHLNIYDEPESMYFFSDILDWICGDASASPM
jgi:hypothetical protein